MTKKLEKIISGSLGTLGVASVAAPITALTSCGDNSGLVNIDDYEWPEELGYMYDKYVSEITDKVKLIDNYCHELSANKNLIFNEFAMIYSQAFDFSDMKMTISISNLARIKSKVYMLNSNFQIEFSENGKQTSIKIELKNVWFTMAWMESAAWFFDFSENFNINDKWNINMSLSEDGDKYNTNLSKEGGEYNGEEVTVEEAEEHAVNLLGELFSVPSTYINYDDEFNETPR